MTSSTAGDRSESFTAGMDESVAAAAAMEQGRASGSATPEHIAAAASAVHDAFSSSSEGTPSYFALKPTGVQPPAPPQLTLSTPMFLGARSSSHDGTSAGATGAAAAATPSGALQPLPTNEHEFAVSDDPSPVLANPTLGLTSLSEALAHLVNFEPRDDHDESSRGASAAASTMAADDKEGKSPEGGNTAVGSSRCSTALSSETGMTSPSGRSQAAIFSPPSPASGTTAKAVPANSSTTNNDDKDDTAEHDDERRAQAASSVHPFPRPSGSRRPSQAALSGTSTPASAERHSVVKPSAAAALLHKVNNELGSASVGPSSGKNSGQSSSNVSGLSTPISGHVVGRDAKPTVLETHHLQLQTHGPSGRRMINQYVIENELGRGVHGKVRLARDTETGERVAVKIVEREGKRKLGGLGKNKENARMLRNPSSFKGKEPMYRSMVADDETAAAASGTASPSTETRKLPDTPGSSNDVAVQRAHFAAQLPPGSRGPSSPTSTIGGARFGRWGEGASSRPTYADLELERQREREREKARKRMLWTTDQKVKREIAIMKKCAHENVVRLKEVIDDPQSKKIFMVLEYMEGGEVKWKDDRGFPTLTVDETRRALRDVVLGLEYLHYQGIIHRDIKPANLLCDAEGHVKISDFGVSHFSYAMLVARGGIPSANEEGDTADPSLVDDRELAKTAGSPAFFAPELCMASDPLSLPRSKTAQDTIASGSNPAPESVASRSKRPTVTKSIDVWALGVTLYCLLFGHVPFTADSEYALFSVIAKEDYALPAYMGADRVLIGPRKKRWTTMQPWMDEEGDVDPDSSRDEEPDVDESLLGEEAKLVRDLLERLLDKDPATRIKLEEVKKHPWLTQDIADPPAWLSSTDPTQLPFVQVSHEEVQGALTGFSKFKQTMKRLQAKVMTALSGQHGEGHDWNEVAHGDRGRIPIYERRNQHLRLHRRPRSKSASIADSDGRPDLKKLLQMQQARQGVPQSTNISAQPSAQPSPTVHMSHGSRGRFPFVRRRSVMLEAIKQDLQALQDSPSAGNLATEGRAASSGRVSAQYSQTTSPELELHHGQLHGPSQLSRDITDSSLVWVEGGAESIPSAEMFGSKSSKRPHRFFRRALSRPSQHSDKLVIDTTPNARYLPSHGSGQSRGSGSAGGRAGDDTSMRASMSAGPFGELDENALASGMTSRQSSASRTKPPSRQRSRSRLGEVFRHVWHVPHHKHADHEHVTTHRSGGELRASAEGSRPGTAASQILGHAHTDGLLSAPADHAHHHLAGAGIGMTPAGLSPALSTAQTEVLAEHAIVRRPSYFGPDDSKKVVNAHRDEQPANELHNDSTQQNAVDVDEYDVDLELSDDDSDEASQLHGGQPLLHLNQSGWVTQQDQASHSATQESEQASHFGLHTTDSLTPSVEGGYNVFKPPYIGKVKRAQSSDAASGLRVAHDPALDAPQPFTGVQDGNDSDAIPRNALAAPNQHDYDISGVSDDRFADADETEEEEQQSGDIDDGTGGNYAPHYHQEALTEAEMSYAPHAQRYMDGSSGSQDEHNGIPASHSKGGGSLPVTHLDAARHATHSNYASEDEGEEDEDEDDDEDGLNFRARRIATTG